MTIWEPRPGRVITKKRVITSSVIKGLKCNSTNGTESLTNERRNKRTNICMDERNDENYIPLYNEFGGKDKM